ncbi:fibroblast growth factor receptor 3-like [Montipora foliosa]|uniref:fibroblast growth factor receptor 3-like n=1 Tax=Montipora foliosa TaxID=591990 RepID=UPI0035F15FD1
MSLANEEYHEDLHNLESKRSQQLIERFEQTVKEAFQTDSTFQRIHVLDFTPGSVIVKFVLIFKQCVSTDHAISILKAAVDNGKFGPFTVNTKSIMASEKDEFQIIYITGIPSSVSDRSARTLFNRTILVAVTASCILVAVIISLVIYVIWLRRKVSEGKKRKKRTNEEPSEEDEKGNTAVEMGKLDFQRPASTTISQSREHAQLSTFPSKRSWEISRDLVTVEKIIGKGAFGQVAKGSAVGLRGMRQKTTVAVKMLKDSAPYSDKKGLLSELEVMKTLKPHPNIIRLMGCVTESEPLLVLIEYVPYGDLLGYLRKSRGMKDTYYKDPDIKPQTSLTSQQLIKFAWQIADGMKFLSSSSVIHRDLAARNVLIGERETCKVSDFGMARDVQQENIYKRSTKGRLPLKWTAYEALMYGTYTTQSDVWSYGIVLYEIFTIGGSPYPKIDRMNIVDFLQQGHRMPKPQHVDDELYKIMRMCWEEDPNARPTFHNLKDTLKNMERHHKRMINMAMYDETRPYANVNVEDLAT